MAKKLRKKKSKQKDKQRSKLIANILYGSFFSIFAIGVYITAERLESAFTCSCNSFLKSTGFKVDSIIITGAKNNSIKETITKQSGLSYGDNIFKLSTEDIYQNIIKMTNIKSATVRKNLPNSIIIDVTEKTPIAIFQKDMKFYLIDKEGTTISEVTTRIGSYPIIAGDDADKNANVVLNIIAKFPTVKNKLDSMIFVRKRRWDIVVAGGILVKLPEDNIEKVVESLSILLSKENINKNTVKSIDLRVTENIIINGLKLKQKSKSKTI